jgi:hypothetical protein
MAVFLLSCLAVNRGKDGGQLTHCFSTLQGWPHINAFEEQRGGTSRSTSLSLSLSLSLLSAAFLFFSVRSTHCSLSLSHPSPVGGACSLSLSLSLSPSLSHIHQQRVVHCLSHTSSAVRGGRSHIQSWCVMAPINEQWVVHLSLLHPSASRGGWHCLSRIHLQFGGSLSLTSISSARCSLSLSRIHH